MNYKKYILSLFLIVPIHHLMTPFEEPIIQIIVDKNEVIKKNRKEVDENKIKKQLIKSDKSRIRFNFNGKYYFQDQSMCRLCNMFLIFVKVSFQKLSRVDKSILIWILQLRNLKMKMQKCISSRFPTYKSKKKPAIKEDSDIPHQYFQQVLIIWDESYNYNKILSDILNFEDNNSDNEFIQILVQQSQIGTIIHFKDHHQLYLQKSRKQIYHVLDTEPLQLVQFFGWFYADIENENFKQIKTLDARKLKECQFKIMLIRLSQRQFQRSNQNVYSKKIRGIIKIRKELFNNNNNSLQLLKKIIEIKYKNKNHKMETIIGKNNLKFVDKVVKFNYVILVQQYTSQLLKIQGKPQRKMELYHFSKPLFEVSKKQMSFFKRMLTQ